MDMWVRCLLGLTVAWLIAIQTPRHFINFNWNVVLCLVASRRQQEHKLTFNHHINISNRTKSSQRKYEWQSEKFCWCRMWVWYNERCKTWPTNNNNKIMPFNLKCDEYSGLGLLGRASLFSYYYHVCTTSKQAHNDARTHDTCWVCRPQDSKINEWPHLASRAHTHTADFYLYNTTIYVINADILMHTNTVHTVMRFSIIQFSMLDCI